MYSWAPSQAVKFPLTLVSESFLFFFKQGVFWVGWTIGAILLQALEGSLCVLKRRLEVPKGVASHYLCPNPVFQELRGGSLNSAFSRVQGENMLQKCHRGDPCMSWWGKELMLFLH